MAVFRVKHNISLLGQNCQNIYFYEDNDLGDSADLFSVFLTGPHTSVLPVMSSLAVVSNIQVENMGDPADFAEGGGGGAGTRGPDVMPPFVAWGFKFRRATLTTRNGAKRIPGVAESDVLDGVASGVIVANLTALAASMLVALVGAADTYTPRIVRLTYPGGGLPPVVSVVNSIAGITYERVTTQNTRKFGIGV